MNLRDQPRFIREALAVQETFRRLGFPSDQLYAVPGAGPGDLFAIALLLPDGTRFNVITGRQDISREEATARWKEAAFAWNGSLKIAAEVWQESEIANGGVAGLLVALAARGIELPYRARRKS